MLSKNAKVVFVANLSNTSSLIKHSFTALKFSSKIREAIYKRFARIEQKQKSMLEEQIRLDLDAISKELHLLKSKLITSSTELADGDPLLIQFAEVLDKYEERVHHFRNSTKRAQIQI
jgi:hypothetical protein